MLALSACQPCSAAEFALVGAERTSSLYQSSAWLPALCSFSHHHSHHLTHHNQEQVLAFALWAMILNNKLWLSQARVAPQAALSADSHRRPCAAMMPSFPALFSLTYALLYALSSPISKTSKESCSACRIKTTGQHRRQSPTVL